jgi:hypothetical protein
MVSPRAVLSHNERILHFIQDFHYLVVKRSVASSRLDQRVLTVAFFPDQSMTIDKLSQLTWE